MELRGSTNEKIFFSCSSPYELSFWRDVEVVSAMSNMFLFLDCRDTDRALPHIRSKNGYIYKRNFVRTYQYKSTKWLLIY